ncbi:hypothetical protein [Staphylococcus edaphicus]|uniref:Uncharacterized protein n=1 Tax=Staphylococcus edaphicus TaxID=1955013 RepID=A0A2C6WCI0_9STAP|nr:hypothetical protein [Staphylococcus edaphicus]PHK48578.1 hypothetical protein BTJ66_12990 [Staphylococcus edaphicus]UQW81459.1 hypothetical protein MNY58_13020 [Staphylococcus edaphicus]
MSKEMILHHTLNIVLMIVLIVVNYFNALNLSISIALAISIIINATLLIRANRKQVESNGTTIDDFNKK